MTSVDPMSRSDSTPMLDEVLRWTGEPPRVDDPGSATRRWEASQAAVLSGPANGPPRRVPNGVANGLAVLTSVLEALSGLLVDGPTLVAERAVAAGLSRRGTTSVGGDAHLVEAAGGVVCLNLARPDDVASIPALLGATMDPTDWPAVRRAISLLTGAELVKRADLLGMPFGVPGTAPDRPLVVTIGASRPEVEKQPLVVEFGSLWAAPLCGALLARAGCRVVKVESVHRPDGARRGPAAFFESLNGAKEVVSVDPSTADGLERVRMLVDAADVVLEASRPRALAHWGVAAAEEVQRGTVWASITGYGRTGPRSGGVAFGDDAAVSGGLMLHDPPGFVADAVPDPVTGLLAAVAVQAALADGAGALLDLSLAGVARWLADPEADMTVG